MSFDLMGAVGGALGGLTGQDGPDVTPGAVGAWALLVYADQAGDLSGQPLLSIGSDTYDGTISASLPAGLDGGSYEVVVEGMTDDDYAKLRSGGDLAARLHLWWKDSPSGVLGDLASFTGFTDPLGVVAPQPPEHSLVAELRVDRISRRAGERRYEAVLTLVERVLARTRTARVQGACYDDLGSVLDALARAAGITVTQHQVSDVTPQGNDPSWASVAPGTVLQALRGQGQHGDGTLGQVRDGLRAYGPSVALVRDGALHVGRWDDPALPHRTLDETGGLVKIERGTPRARDEKAGDPPAGAPASREAVTLTALGRPDIKPGDTVTVGLPPADFPATTDRSSIGAALLTTLTGVVTDALGADDEVLTRSCLVVDVAHRLSRRSGFVTTIHAVVLASDDDHGWDAVQTSTPPAPAHDAAPTDRGTGSTDAAQATARRIHDAVAAALPRTPHKVAQIRTHPGTDEGSQDAANTSTVWYADAAGDGLPAAAQRVAITQDRHGELREVPYLSPFAWGHYGLALPRYPGTRVLLATVEGEQDQVDVGALWDRTTGGPPALAGDWWLVLPIDPANPSDIGGGDGTATDGAAVHDLTDQHGHRLIETPQFVVRVTDQATQGGTRPDPDDSVDTGSITIENKSGGNTAQVVLKSDGSITVKGTSITLDTDGQGDLTLKGSSITLDTGGSGDVSIKASNVKVQVSGTMDVS
ncbi:head GIN domain-containing protein [Cellulomonas alba]|uniref:Type IV secretion protein Rhs n=1 Tax=Cellulomonas alba TaxID=3053467 RepID=A0ABT7SI83_9CELL|nr:hypothetical protein [Cellulomonas alba]MDM7855871.1 hypothetical protein [Cellulomonas alba]